MKRLKVAYDVYGMPARTRGAMKAWHLKKQRGHAHAEWKVAQRHGDMHSMLVAMDQTTHEVRRAVLEVGIRTGVAHPVVVVVCLSAAAHEHAMCCAIVASHGSQACRR